MNMSSKRFKYITGIVIAIIGVFLIVYSIHSMNRISEGKSQVHSLTSPFSGSSAGRMVGGALESRASQYDSTVLFLLISGIILTVAGTGAAIIFRKK